MMNLRYYSSYNDIDNVTVTINIYKEGYIGNAESFLLSANPVTITYDTDEVFKPIKYSGCSIRLVTPSILKDLYTSKVTDVYIEILKGGTLFWCGYNTPNVYNQEWLTDYDETSIEGIDTLTALKYFDYEYMNTHNAMYFYDIIAHCLKQTRNNINKLQYRNLLDENNPRLLNDLSCLERNFFDESKNPMKYNEVLEHIMKFLGVTLYQWKDSYYITDNDSLFYDDVNVRTYDLTQFNAVSSISNFAPKEYEVSENTSSVSLGDVYNQVNVIGNLIEVEETTIELDDKNIEPVPTLNGKYSLDLYNTNDDNREQSRILYHFFNKPSWNINLRYNNSATYDNNQYLSNNVYMGSGCMIREAVVKPYVTLIRNNGSIDGNFTPLFKAESKLDFNTYFSYKIGDTYPVCRAQQGVSYAAHNYPDKLFDLTAHEVLSYTTENYISYPKNGYFLLHFNFDLSKYFGKKSEFIKEVNKGSGKSYYGEFAKPKMKNNINILDRGTAMMIYYFGFRARLQVGNKYWDGESWQYEECDFTFRTENRENFNAAFINVDESQWGTWEIENTNSYTINTKSTNNGWVIPITEDLSGRITFTLYDCLLRPNYNSETADVTEDEGTYNYVNVNTLSLEYTPYNDADVYQINNEDDDDKDLKYSQAIDNNNVTEFDDITLYLNTYNPNLCKKLSYSYVFNAEHKYLDKLSKLGTKCRPEEHIVRMYANHYGKPKILHSNTIKSKDITPMDIVYVNSLKKYMNVGSITYNLTYNESEVNLYEL